MCWCLEPSAGLPLYCLGLVTELLQTGDRTGRWGMGGEQKRNVLKPDVNDFGLIRVQLDTWGHMFPHFVVES